MCLCLCLVSIFNPLHGVCPLIDLHPAPPLKFAVIGDELEVGKDEVYEARKQA